MSVSAPERTQDAPVMERLYTAEELAKFPSHWRYELIQGKLRKMPPTGESHGSYTADLTIEIGWYVRSNQLGQCYAAEMGFYLSRNPDNVKAPDFAFVAKDRLPAQRGAGYMAIVPDLVLETRSPSDRTAGIRDKINEWLVAGVRMVLDLDPARRVLTVYRPDAEPVTLTETDTLDGGDVLPGFTLPLTRLFS